MRLPPPSNGGKFSIDHSELFEAAFYKLKETYPYLMDAYDNIEWSLQRDPREQSMHIAAFPDRDIRVHITAKTPRFPALRVLIEIKGQRVYCWHVSEM
jgi:hypothetical protein